MSKVLSIKQPWASLIVYGVKDVENRTWATKYRGKILIHASAQIVKHEFISDIFSAEQFSYLKTNDLLDIIKTVKLSSIIGEATIVDCVVGHESIWAEKATFPQNSKPIYNWVLQDVVLYENPLINVKGKLGLWNFDYEHLKK